MLTTFAERLLQSGTVLERMQIMVVNVGLIVLKFQCIQARTEGGLRGFDRTPYFSSLKLILSLNIKY